MASAEEKNRIVVGSETQSYETHGFVTGIQRVLCETHKGLFDFLGTREIEIGWLHTREATRSTNFRKVPYFAEDPVLEGKQVALEDVDALLLFDLALNMDFGAVAREKKRRGLPVFAMVYDILPLRRPDWFTNDAYLGFKLWLQQILFVSDYIVVNSQEVKENIEALGWALRSEIFVIPLGSVHTQRAASNTPRAQVSALCVNTIAPRKGHEILLDAFDLLRKSDVDVDLTLVGRIGWECDDLVERLRNHPDISGRLKWIRDGNDDTVKALASHCNIGLIPSEGEGFGMFLEEALTLGLKVVASDIPVFRERKQANVFYSELTAKALAESMVRAAETEWVPFGRGEVRSMRDFSRDVSDLIVSKLSEGLSDSRQDLRLAQGL